MRIRLALLLILALLAGCTRGPDEDTLAGDLQARLDAVFGQPLVEVATLRRQGSAPYRAAPDGSRQVIVYFNAALRFVAAYDPSDWESLNPALIANALGATDRGVFGLGPGRHEPGAGFRSHGSLVYRKAGDGWVPSDERLLATAVDAGGPPTGTSGADELVQRLAKIVMQSPRTRGADREIITEEIDRALRNISLRLQREHEGVAVAAGPMGGEYWRFLSSVTQGLPESAGIQVVATEGSVANAFLIQSQRARIGVMQSDVAAAAVTGQGVFAETGPLSHLRAAASLFPEPVHIVVRANSEIVRIADLAGRRVALGSPQSGSRHTALRLLAHAGIDPAGLERVEYGSPADALARLASGEIDAVIEVASAPWQQLEAVLGTTPLRLIGLDTAQAARLGADLPGLLPLAIPARTYAGQTEAVSTVAATALLVAHSDVAEVTVEAVLEYLYAAAAERGGVLAARLSKERAQAGITIPMHEGARRFFAQTTGAAGLSGNP
jgi:TRAP transporter TAXI family solute receptor